MSSAFFFVHQSQPEQLENAGHLHAEVLRAVADSKEDAAAKAAERLVGYIEGFTRAILNEQY